MAWEDALLCARPVMARLDAARHRTAVLQKANKSVYAMRRTIKFLFLIYACTTTNDLTHNSSFGHQRQFDKALLTRSVCVENTLHSFPVIPRLGPEDIRHKSLRVAVVQREPA